MGVVLERAAYSPNIKERRDHSCAVFDARGRLAAQAAHIPVHLGAFPQMMATLVPRFRWRPGDLVICNDPFVGGTHLPDISVISPVFVTGRLRGFVANRAHHADIGGAFPGSMAPTTEIYQEGVILPPICIRQRGRWEDGVLELFLRNVRTPEERRGDLAAQFGANDVGVQRFVELAECYGAAELRRRMDEARRRSNRATAEVIAGFPAGRFTGEDWLDDDGHGSGPLPIRVSLLKRQRTLIADFTGTAPQQRGSINATLAVTHSAVYYALLCLLPEGTPLNQGVFERVRVLAPEGTLVNACSPAAVAAGNVETSQRTVDAVFAALAQAFPHRIPAASQGTMNNFTLGGQLPETRQPWAYYETTGGGAGASPESDGISAVHCHMSNTRNTPAEAMEYHYPVRVRANALRTGSGGRGRHRGGDGVVRELELLAPATAVLLTDRRSRGPYGRDGGSPGRPGSNELYRDGRWGPAPAKGQLELTAGERIRLATPGGGAWGHGPASPGEGGDGTGAE